MSVDQVLSNEYLQTIFNEQSDQSGFVPECNILPLFRQLYLTPSRQQVRHILWGCKKCFCVPAGVPFAAFCVFVQEFAQQKELSPQLPCSIGKKLWETPYYNQRNQETVFLGGSCNPTTWRQKIAVPFFKDKQIPFFNPQVSDWRQELVQIEEAAKKDAELLFFVIDINQTRSASSMIEAAYLAGCDRQLVLVISQFRGQELEVRGEKITEREYSELCRSQEVVIDCVERMKIPVFRDIHPALQCAAKVIKQKCRVQDLDIDDGARPISSPQVKVAHNLVKYKNVFDSIDSTQVGKLNLKDVSLAYQSATNGSLNISGKNRWIADKNSFTFEDFCLLCTEPSLKVQKSWSRVVSLVWTYASKISSWFQRPVSTQQMFGMREIHLGGYKSSTWREVIAIPILKKHGIPYSWADNSDNVACIHSECMSREKCSLLLYFISSDCRGLNTMCKVAFYIGLGCHMVLVIQNIAEGAEMEGEELSPEALSDYNRGRSYLAHLANREGIPVFDDVEEAVHCCVAKVIQFSAV